MAIAYHAPQRDLGRETSLDVPSSSYKARICGQSVSSERAASSCTAAIAACS